VIEVEGLPPLHFDPLTIWSSTSARLARPCQRELKLMATDKQGEHHLRETILFHRRRFLMTARHKTGRSRNTDGRRALMPYRSNPLARAGHGAGPGLDDSHR